ncbi:MAG: DUF3846 domain-containing protein [Alistipes sp.]|nr:DUF3846 domain-containing protein [Alistipes sp.]
MKILVCEPGRHPYIKDIDSTLENFQRTVGGYIEALYPFEDRVAIVCDEESKLKSDTQWNRTLPECRDIIKGTFFICGIGDEDFTDIPPDLAEKYKKRFWNIEHFIPTPHGLLPIVFGEE